MVRDLDVIAIGNAIVDMISSSDDALLTHVKIQKGAMELIDSERARFLEEKMVAPVVTCGGSAANTIVGLSNLGAKCGFIGKVKDDGAGKQFKRSMEGLNIIFETPPNTEGKPTAKCLIFVTPDAQRSMNTFLGASTELQPSDISKDFIGRSKILYLEGYLWDPPNAKKAFLEAINIAKASDTKVALSLSDAFCVDRYRSEFLDLVRTHVDILFGNETEILSLYQTENLNEATELVQDDCEIVAVTRDSRGSIVIENRRVFEIAAEKIDTVIDTTGAGDLYASGFLYGMTRDMDIMQCGRLAGLAASSIITQFGARPEESLMPLIDRVSASN